MKKSYVILIALICWFSKSSTYSPIVYYNTGQAYNFGQPYGFNIFDTIMHNRGSFKPGFACIPSLSIGNPHGAGLDLLLTYHQNLYPLIDGLFFQVHLPMGLGVMNMGANLATVLGYHFINTPRIISTVHLDAILSCNRYRPEGSLTNAKNKKVGVGLNTLITLCGNTRHNLKLLNELRYHYECKSVHRNDLNQQNPGSLGDIIAGLIYQFKAFFIGAGYCHHINHSLSNDLRSSFNTNLVYFDLGYHKRSGSFWSIGIGSGELYKKHNQSKKSFGDLSFITLKTGFMF
jgi:hypothetical protein